MTIGLHNIRSAKSARHKRKRVGRGNASGHGTYSTRGLKGQRSRSGGKSGLKRLGMKQIITSLPKLGGFTSRHVKPEVVSLTELDRIFKTGAVVNMSQLKKHKLVSVSAKAVKIVGSGKLKKALTIDSRIMFTAGARGNIEQAGGKVGVAQQAKVAKKKSKK